VIGVLQKELADMVEAIRARETEARDAAAALEDRSLALHKLVDAIREVTAVTDLDQLLQRLTETACRLTGARYGALGVFDKDGKRLTRFFTVGIDEATHKAIGDLPTGRGLLGALAHDMDALRLKDLTQHPASVGFPPHHPPMHSFLGMSIRSHGRLFGRLYLTEKQAPAQGEEVSAEFTELDEKLIVGLATQAGVAIEIARLLHDTRDAEAQYRAAKDQLANVLEHAPDPIIFTNLSGHITLYNKGAERVLGYAASDMLGKPTTDLYLDPAERATVLAELDAKGEVIGREVRLRTRDGRTVTLSLTLSPYRDAEGHVIGTVGVSKDITAAKLLEQALRTSNQELEGFVYVISHDLQTPLRGIHGFADLLVKRMKDKLDERERHYVARIQAGAQRMATLINDLLEYSRLERMAQPFEKVRMQDVLDQALRDLDHLIRGSRAVVQCDGPLPVVWGDRTRLGLVWTNLLTNAIKYARPDEAPRISIRCREDEREFVFQCRDNGIGIAPEFHTHIFDLFRRLHTTDKFEGTGVGLAIVKRVMELHHGRIWVESAAGQGATFWFTLPKTQPNSTQALAGHRNPTTIKETAS
jgi:PAS domain S-box-containing protein